MFVCEREKWRDESLLIFHEVTLTTDCRYQLNIVNCRGEHEQTLSFDLEGGSDEGKESGVESHCTVTVQGHVHSYQSLGGGKKERKHLKKEREKGRKTKV